MRLIGEAKQEATRIVVQARQTAEQEAGKIIADSKKEAEGVASKVMEGVKKEAEEKAAKTVSEAKQKAEQINTKIKQLQSNDQLTHNQARKRITQVNQIKKHAVKLAHYENQERILNGRRSYSKTDTDATFMRLKDDQLVPAYNIIHGTENQFIVNYTIHQTAGETNEFVKHIKQLKRMLAFFLNNSKLFI